jgi:ketosteroid isomerase-like protein
MSTAENQALVRRFFAEVCNGRDLAVADELFAADHTYHVPFIPTGRGPEGMKQGVAPTTPPSPALICSLDRRGDDRHRRHGRDAMDRQRRARRSACGHPPTSKRVVAVPEIWIHRLTGGTIVES